MSVKTSQLNPVTDLSSDDLIQIIDVSDVLPSGMSVNGTNKKITAGNLASSLLTVGGYAVSTHVHTAATVTAPGFMSVADKIKLNGISELSGSNTGDETASTIKTKLGVTTLSGSNTGDETASTIKTALAITTLSGSNTGDETASTIKTKLGVTTLSGSNTGDQTITLTGDVTGNGTSSFATTLANSGVTAGEYNKSATTVTPFTVDSKGRVTNTGTAVTIKPDWSNITSKPTTLSGYGITDGASASWLNITSKPTTLSGYGITDGAPLASPTFTGNVTLAQAPTNNLHAATKEYVDTAITAVGGITLTQQTALDLKANLSGPIFTGAPKAPTANITTNSEQIATTAYVQKVVQKIVTNGFDFNSPTFTGTPKAPTAELGTNTEQIATTAYVKNAIDSINVGGGGAIISYTVTSNVPTVAEGSTVTFTVLTNSQATTLYWTTDATDVSPVSGIINLNSGVGIFSVTASADAVAETNDNFIVYVRTGGPTGIVVANCLVNISDTAVVAPGTDTYIVTPNVNLIAEGSDVTFTVVVNTAATTTTLYWTAPAADFTTSSGQFSVEGNVGIFTVRAKTDSITEGIESLNVQVRTGSITGQVEASCVVSISDNPVTISMTPSSTTIKEGESVTFNVTATNTPGTTMYWTTDSNATTLKSDSVAILNNAGSFSVKAATNDVWSTTTQSFIVSLRLVDVTGPIVTQREITVLEGSGEAAPVWERQATNTILTRQSVFNGSGDIAAGITATGGVTVMRYSTDLIWKTADGISLTTPGAAVIAMNSSGNIIALVDTSDYTVYRFPVKIYKWNGSIWNQLGQAIYPPNGWGASSGTATSINTSLSHVGINMSFNADGSRLIIGQPNYRDQLVPSTHGMIRMYQFNVFAGAQGEWQQMGSSIIGVSINTGDTGYPYYDSPLDRVGTIVAMNATGDRIASYRMSTYKINSPNSNYGSYTYTYPTLEVYQWSSNAWSRLGGVIVGEVPTDGFSSISLSSDGNRIAVGSVHNDDAGYNTGSTRVYEFIAGAWQKIGQDLDGEAYEDLSGISVSLNGDGTRVAISAPRNDDAGTNAGHTRVYRWDASTNKWVKIGLDISWPGGTNNDHSHRNVDINYAGDAVIISGNGEAFTGTGVAGIVTNNRVYKLVSSN